MRREVDDERRGRRGAARAPPRRPRRRVVGVVQDLVEDDEVERVRGERQVVHVAVPHLHVRLRGRVDARRGRRRASRGSGRRRRRGARAARAARGCARCRCRRRGRRRAAPGPSGVEHDALDLSLVRVQRRGCGPSRRRRRGSRRRRRRRGARRTASSRARSAASVGSSSGEAVERGAREHGRRRRGRRAGRRPTCPRESGRGGRRRTSSLRCRETRGWLWPRIPAQLADRRARRCARRARQAQAGALPGGAEGGEHGVHRTGRGSRRETRVRWDGLDVRSIRIYLCSCRPQHLRLAPEHPTPCPLPTARPPSRASSTPREIVLFDGAMGTMLYARGVFINQCYDELDAPRARPRARRARGVREGRRRGARDEHASARTALKLAQYGLETQVARDQPARGASWRARRRATARASSPARSARSACASSRTARRSATRRARSSASRCTALRDGRRRPASSSRHSPTCTRSSRRSSPRATVEPGDAGHRADDDRRGPAARRTARRPRTWRARSTRWGADVIGLNCSVGPQTILEAIERMAAVTRTQAVSASRTPACRARSAGARCTWRAPSTWRRTRGTSCRPARRSSAAAAARRPSTSGRWSTAIRPLAARDSAHGVRAPRRARRTQTTSSRAPPTRRPA